MRKWIAELRINAVRKHAAHAKDLFTDERDQRLAMLVLNGHLVENRKRFRF